MPDEASDVNFGLEIGKGFIGRIAISALGIIGMIVFANVLGAEGLGSYYLLFSIVIVLSRPLIGWGVAAKKRASETDADRASILGAVFTVSIGAILIVTLLSYLFDDFLVQYLGIEMAPILLIILFASEALFGPFTFLVSASGRVGREVGVDAARSLFTLPGQIALVVVGFGVAGMVAAMSAGTILVLPMLYFFIGHTPAIPSRETFESIATYARYSVGAAVIDNVYDRFDPIILGFLVSPAVVGIYEVALRLTQPGMFVAKSTRSGLMARISNKQSKGMSFRDDIFHATSVASIIAVPLFFGAVAIGTPLIPILFGAEFTSGFPLLLGLAVFRFIHSQVSVQEAVLKGVDRPDTVMEGSIIRLVGHLIIGIPLVLEYGALGIVFSTVLSEAAQYAYLWTQIDTDYRPSLTRPLLHQVFAGVVMASVVWPLSRFLLSQPGLLRLFVCVFTGVIAYAAVLLAVSDELRQLVDGALPNRITLKRV